MIEVLTGTDRAGDEIFDTYEGPELSWEVLPSGVLSISMGPGRRVAAYSHDGWKKVRDAHRLE